ncbi:MAG: MMPL family transporter [Gammaproteobacteria bacterium]|nr:MAG: MMPL family transporter [Gammaproteobacteria bacterium]
MSKSLEKVIAILWLLVLAASCVLFLKQANVVTDMTSLMPGATSPTDKLMLQQLRQGPASRMLIIGISGSNPGQLAEFSTALAEYLRSSDHFVYVNNGGEEASDKDREFVMSNRYLLSPADSSRIFSVVALKAKMQQQLQVLASPLGALTRSDFVRDPTGEALRLLQLWSSGLQQPEKQYGVWFSADGKRALMIAESKAAAFDLDRQETVLATIQKKFDSIKGKNKATLIVSGPPVFAVDARRTIRKEVMWLTLISSSLVLAFLLFVYRSLVLVLIAGIPLLSGIIIAALFVNTVFGQIHGITLAFGITIIGVAVDYPIHLFTHRAPGESARVAMRRIWPTMLLAVVTTAVGYSAMILSGFAGLAQLGVFAIVGLLTAALVTYSILPVFMNYSRAHVPVYSGVVSFMALMQPLKWLPLLLIILSSIILFFMQDRLWENDIANLNPASKSLKKNDKLLRQELKVADVARMLVVEADSLQSVLQKSERLVPELDRLVVEKVMDGYDHAARYLPSEQQQQQRQQALPGVRELRTTMTLALQGTLFRQSGFTQFIREVQASKTQALITLKDLDNTSMGLRLRSLLFRQDKHWVSLIPLHGNIKTDQLKAWVTTMSDPGLRFLDLKEASNRIINHYRDEALWYVAIGTIVILVLLLLRFRSIVVVTRILLPIVAAELTVVVVLLLLGFKLSVFHLVGLLLVMGIGLDYSLFFNREHNDASEGHRTTQSLIVCSVTTILVFGVLAFSQTPVLSTIGLTASIGSLLCLLLSAAMVRKSWGYAPTFS